jgi:hypothetical protein
MADSACSAVRARLFSGCCAVKVEAAVWVWKRSVTADAEPLLQQTSPERSRSAEFGYLRKKVIVCGKEKRKPGRCLLAIESGGTQCAELRASIG